MSDESAALDALKTILATIDPTPEPSPVLVLAYPADYERIKFERLPVVIVSKIINQTVPWGRVTHGRGRHAWPAEILVFLADGPITNDKMAAMLEPRATPWPLAMSSLLSQNLQLSSTVSSIGDGDTIFTYQVGHIHFWTKVFFGVKFEMVITQDITQVLAR